MADITYRIFDDPDRPNLPGFHVTVTIPITDRDTPAARLAWAIYKAAVAFQQGEMGEGSAEVRPKY